MKIVCDIDECLVQYLGGFCDFWNNETGDNLKFEDFKTFSFQDTLGISIAEKRRVIEDYLLSSYFDDMKFVDGAQEGIERLARGNELSFVTVRPDEYRYKTLSFFDNNFPKHSFDVYFEKGSKLARLKVLRPDVVIEDSVGSLEYAEAGFNVILFDREWNHGVEHENIYRRFDWGGIDDVVEELRYV